MKPAKQAPLESAEPAPPEEEEQKQANPFVKKDLIPRTPAKKDGSTTKDADPSAEGQ